MFAMKLTNHETTWVPMKVASDDIARMQELGLVDPNQIGDTLHLSFPSLSRDKEMRFRLNRAFVGDGDATSYGGINGHLGEDSIEILVDDIEPVTWTAEDWPQDGVKTEDWGHSLRCLSFIDEHTLKLLEDHKKQEDATKYNRSFDLMSRLYVCEDPVKVATLTLKAHTEKDNFDWIVYD